MSDTRPVILSGMRPTGRLHLGHLEGALKNYLKLQEQGALCYFMVADLHALSTEYKNPAAIAENNRELLLDWLSVGLDPEKSTMFVQSDVPEHCELFVILSMLTPLAWAERVPTYKEQLQELADRDIATYGFLGYPILQAADILLYRATLVPVGQDQLPHLEMTREIVRRFNFLYGEDTLPEPQPMLTQAPKVPGLDGRKMSKSYGNAIFLADSDQDIENKVKQMYTDPQKLRATTPGHPDNCVVLALYKMYVPEEAPGVESECRAGTRGCVTCKKGLMPILKGILGPIRARREMLACHPERLGEIVNEGCRKARERARETMEIARRAMGWGPAPSADRREGERP